MHECWSVEELLEELSKKNRGFPCSADDIDLIEGPKEFFEELCRRIDTAKRRVSLSVLYFGTGQRETELRRRLLEALRRGVEVRIYMDEGRGLRGSKHQKDCVSFFDDLRDDGLKIFLVPSPGRHGLYGMVLPDRINELVGVYHAKAMIFDDEIIVTGANIGDTYLHSRIDRYYVFRVPDLVEQFSGFFRALEPFCFEPFNPEAERDESLGSKKREKGLAEAILSWTRPRNTGFAELDPPRTGHDTVLYFSAQFKDIVTHDFETMLKVLKTRGDLRLSTAYINFPAEYTEAMLNRPANFAPNVLMAASSANSFKTDRGVEKYICLSYEYNALRFTKQTPAATVQQWVPPEAGMSFHAKGLWLDTHRQNGSPLSFSVVGSSNHGMRANTRDLEASVTIATENPDLRRRFRDETTRLWAHAQPLNFKPPTCVTRMIGPVVRSFF